MSVVVLGTIEGQKILACMHQDTAAALLCMHIAYCMHAPAGSTMRTHLLELVLCMHAQRPIIETNAV